MWEFIKRNKLLVISFIYILWPLDIITEFIGPWGLIDDAGLLFFAIARAIYVYRKDKAATDLSEEEQK